MYEVPEETQDYRQKWLEAEHDLALMGVGLQSGSPNYEPIDNVDKDISIEPCINKEVSRTVLP